MGEEIPMSVQQQQAGGDKQAEQNRRMSERESFLYGTGPGDGAAGNDRRVDSNGKHGGGDAIKVAVVSPESDGYPLIIDGITLTEQKMKPSGDLPDDDELNMKNKSGADDTDGKYTHIDDEGDDIPKDRFNFVYLIMLIHGLGVLMPWNMFITAESYFVDYKLSPGSQVTVNGTVQAGTESEYSKNFLEYMGIVAQLPNLALNFLNLFFQIGGHSRIRIVYAISLSLVMFLITVVLAMVDSSSWPAEFFYITMITVAIVNCATGVYQNSVFGLAAILPMKYTNAVVLGNNVSGTFTAIVGILSKVSAPNLRTAAIWYFTAAVFVLLVCLDTYFALPLLKFFRYYDVKNQKHFKEGAIQRTTSRPPYLRIFKKIWIMCFNIWFVFFVTLTCFPAIQANIRPVDTSLGLVKENLFTEVTCFLFFNLFAVVGNIIPGFIKFPGPRWVWVPILLRVLFIPLLMLCNYRPEYRTIPVYIENDYAYMVIAILMAVTSGYFSSLVMMYTPGLVESQYASTAGQMAAFFLVFGIFSGVTFSRAVSGVIEVDW